MNNCLVVFDLLLFVLTVMIADFNSVDLYSVEVDLKYVDLILVIEHIIVKCR